MADRRMFSKKIISSGRFLKMPPTSRLLYYDLGMAADDDGVVEAYTVMTTTKATEDDLRVLISKGYIKLLNEDMVAYICDWKKNNLIKSDRYHESEYKDLLVQFIESEESGTKVEPIRNQIGTKVEPEVRLGKSRLGKSSSGKCVQSEEIVYELKKEKLTQTDYNTLVNAFGKEITETVIQRVLAKPYYNCLNLPTLTKWCEEQKNKPQTQNTQFNREFGFKQREYDYEQLENQLTNY